MLEVRFDLLIENGHDLIPPWMPPVPTVAASGQIDEIAKLLTGAANPIIITEHGGRTDDERNALVRIAEALCAPVFEVVMPSYHNFPRTHPLYGAGPVEAVLGEADVILLAGCNAPWHPPCQDLRPGCAVIHLEEDPLRPRAAYWGYTTNPHDPRKSLSKSSGTRRARPRPIDSAA